VGVIALLAEIGLRMLAFGGDRRDRDRKQNPVLLIIALVFVILAPLAAQFVHLAVSRNREYLADATAVEFTRNSAGMISALQKIADSNPRLKVKRAKKATASMYITNPFNEDRQKQSFASWFATHPPIPDRIARLEQM
jgi:heat shock protein HtpX